MGPTRLCLTQHVSLQTSELSAQLGGWQRPHCHFAERRACIRRSRRLFGRRGAQRGDRPICQEALGTVGLRSGGRSTHHLQDVGPHTGAKETAWASASSSHFCHFALLLQPQGSGQEITNPQGLILGGAENSLSVATIRHRYLTPCSISSLWLNSVSSSVCSTPITPVRVSSQNQHSHSDLYWCC